MKTQIAVLAAASLLVAAPLFADEEDSLTKKALKYEVYKESDNDSTLKKAAGLKVTGEVLDDPDDSAVKKAANLKILKEASE